MLARYVDRNALATILIPPIALVFASDIPASDLAYWFSTCVDEMFPCVSAVASMSPFPFSAKLYWVLAIILAPVQIALLYKSALARGGEHLKRILLSNATAIPVTKSIGLSVRWSFPLCMLALMVLAIFGQFVNVGDLSTCQGCSTSSKIGFLLFSSLTVFVFVFGSVGFFVWFRLLAGVIYE